jgi:class 3 adenylate cyclase
MSTPADIPRHRAIVAVDIEGSTKHTNSVRALLRNVLFQLLDEAFTIGEIGRKHREPFVDRGDGALCLVRPFDQVPKTLLLATFVPALADLLEKHARNLPDLAFRLRVAVHAGEVHRDSRGPYGEDVDIACRLVDAPELKRRLRETTGPLALAVSQEIHRAVVRHGYPGIDRAAFTQAVHIKLGEERLRGWLYTPEARAPQEDLTA